MTCDRVQAEISRSHDEDQDLSPEAARHLAGCADCDEFRKDSLEIAALYAGEVRAGIDRLRGGEPTPRAEVRRLRTLLPAAALLLVCWGIAAVKTEVPPARPVASSAAPAPDASRPRVLPSLPDLDDLGLLVERPPIPLRLDQEFLPTRIDASEISLPRSLRF